MARVQVHGISARIDGCERLLYKQANHFHNHLPAEHQRWIDLEDVLQEGLLAAWQSEQKFSSTWGPQSALDNQASKGRRPFSTYMAYGVRNRFSQTFRSPLSQQKRLSTGIVSITDPVPGTEDMMLADILLSPDPTPEMMEIGITTFAAIGRRLGGDAAAFFVATMSLGVWPVRAFGAYRLRSLMAQIRRAVLAVGSGFEEMVTVADSKLFRRKTLTLAREFTKMTSTGGHDLKILDCVKCRQQYSLKDVEHGRFEPETLTCSDCYQKMQSSAPERSCFGKTKTEDHEGFSEADPECKLHCRDREICRQYVNGGRKMGTATEEVLDDIDFEEDTEAEDMPENDDVAEPAPVKKTSKKATKPAPAKAAKPAKTAKAAKPAKSPKPAKTAKAEKKQAPNTKIVKTTDTGEDKVIKLDDQGRDLPFKPSSWMRGCLVLALDGVKVSKLEADLKKAGADVAFQMKMLRSGNNAGRTSEGGGLLPYPITHTWKITEDKGFIKAHDVKRVATFAKLERVYASKKSGSAKAKKPTATAKKAAKKTAKKK